MYCFLPRAARFPGAKIATAHPSVPDGTQLVVTPRFASRVERLPRGGNLFVLDTEVLIRSAHSRTNVGTLQNVREMIKQWEIAIIRRNNDNGEALKMRRNGKPHSLHDHRSSVQAMHRTESIRSSTDVTEDAGILQSLGYVVALDYLRRGCTGILGFGEEIGPARWRVLDFCERSMRQVWQCRYEWR